MKGPAGVLALVLAETAAGSAAFLWLAPLWGRVKRGFFILTGIILVLLALSAAARPRRPFVRGRRARRW